MQYSCAHINVRIRLFQPYTMYLRLLDNNYNWHLVSKIVIEVMRIYVTIQISFFKCSKHNLQGIKSGHLKFKLN